MAHYDKWFDGVTWVDVCEHGSRDTFTDASTSKAYPCNDKSFGDATEKNVGGGCELKLGMLLLFPMDIIFDILSRIPVEELIRGRIVCKSWNQLTRDPNFIDLQVSKAICQQPSFLCISARFHPGGLVFVDSVNVNWTSKEIPLKSVRVTHTFINSSCNGLLCLSAINREDPIIYNPFTRDCLRLPKSDFKPWNMFACTVFGFAIGFDSINKKYKVVRVYNIYHDIECREFHTKGEVITLGQSSWRTLDFPHKVTRYGIIKSVFLNGAFHWLIHREKDCAHLERILVLDIRNEKFQTIKFPSSIELPVNLDLINFGESLTLFELGAFNRGLLQIWQIVGNRTNGGGLCQFTFDISVMDIQFNRGLTLLGMLSNGDFLCEALQISDVDSSTQALRNHLVRYSPQKKRGFILEIPGIPRAFTSIPFVPSLVSPTTLW